MPNKVREMVKASLYLPSELLAFARQTARLEDRSLTAVLRQAIEIGLAVKKQQRERLEAAS